MSDMMGLERGALPRVTMAHVSVELMLSSRDGTCMHILTNIFVILITIDRLRPRGKQGLRLPWVATEKPDG